MTVGMTDLLDLAISPQIGPVNFFHLRNLLHTLLEHFDIGEIEAQQAEIAPPGGYGSTEESDESSEEDSEEDSESEEESEPEIEIVEEEVQQTVIDDDGNQKTVTVTVQKEVIKEKDPSERKKDGEKRKRDNDPSKDEKTSSDRKDKKGKESKKSKSERESVDKDGRKSKKSVLEKEKGGYGGSVKDPYGSKTSKKETKLTSQNIGEMPEIVNLERRIESVEVGVKSLRNIIDSMVNQVDFGDDVGDMLKAQLDQVQQQMNKVELIPKEEPKDKKKRKGSKAAKGPEGVPQSGIITEGGPPGVGGPSMMAAVIPPPSQRAQEVGKAGKPPSRKENRKVSVAMKGGDKTGRPPSQDGEKPAPLKKRTTLKDLQLRKMAREEGVTIEEIEAREAAKEPEEKKDKKKDKKDKDEKDKDKGKDKTDEDEDEDDSGSEESLDSEEEREAMEEMIMEEIEAALENAADDPEAQAYALRLGLEQMQNMKRNLQTQQDDFKKDMDKNKKAIDQLSRELALFRAARKAQDAEGFNAVHHVHSMVLELQTKHDKITSTCSELVNEYNRREKVLQELMDNVENLDEKKADKQDVTKDIKVKADKEDLESKVSMNHFDESFNLLDRGLNDALEKMGNQMSIEDALKETLHELQSKLTMKLERNELNDLRLQLEERIKEAQVVRTVVREKPEDGEPAGFRRNVTEKVHCISCDRPLEVNPGKTQPNMPKIESLPTHKSGKPYTTYELDHIRQHQKMNVGLRKAVIGADLPYSAHRIKNDVIAMTGLVDLVDLPPSQRYCGGSHTIMHPLRRNFKTTPSHFNQYITIRDDAETQVTLPKREFIVPKDAGQKKYGKAKLPSIRQNSRGPSPPMEYEEYAERPSSAPATPSLYHNNNNNNGIPLAKVRRSMSSPQGDPPVSPTTREGEESPVELGRISVTIPAPANDS